jgi:hypothetical protein
MGQQHFLGELALRAPGDCLEGVYRLSLVGQKLIGDFKKGDRRAILNDIDSIITRLPTVLDTCN